MSQIGMQVKEASSPTELELLSEIEAFDFDLSGSKLPFSRRLARDNGWDEDYAQRVIAEYKRFAFLAMVAAHPVTPSDAVDQAWHLHMVYTESYWKDFCGQVLKKPLHHGPTRGGAQEGAKHFDWYTRTLESYRTCFREEPPEDIWPQPNERFTDASCFRRINTRHVWVIQKPAIWNALTQAWSRRHPVALRPLMIRLSWAACLIVGFVGCVGSMNVFDYRGPEFLEFYLWFAVLFFGAAAVWRYAQRQPARIAQEENLPSDPYEIACLAGGNQRVLESALSELLRIGALEVQPNGKIRASMTSTLMRELRPPEARLRATLGTATGEKFQAVQGRLTGVAEPIVEELASRELMLDRQSARRVRRQTLALAAIVPLIGVIKIMVGVSRDRPVGFLIFLTLIATVIALVAFSRLPQRTRLGDSALKLLRKRHADLRRERALQGPATADAGALPTAVGLFGFGMLANTPMAAEYQRMQASYQNSSGGHGCSSSDGGSDGGSGCGGGCGGCGGGGGD